MDARVLSRFPAGSRPVYAAGEVVLKLYPQADGNASALEAGVLSAVGGALPVAAPRVHATGDWDGWSYLLMSRLPGVPLDVAWPDVPAQGRAELAVQAGELLAALHRVSLPASGCRMRSPSCCTRRLCASTCSSSLIRSDWPA